LPPFKDKIKGEHRQDRLLLPTRPQQGLLVAHLYVAPDQNRIAHSPQIAEVKRCQSRRGTNEDLGFGTFLLLGPWLFDGGTVLLEPGNRSRIPSSSGVCLPAKYALARDMSRARRGWPLGLSVCHTIFPRNPVSRATMSASSRIDIS
jgi:hypothetical protein